jgi:catechol 2,3-dioxygenase-like lactoylglutathione lyase family enzyme
MITGVQQIGIGVTNACQAKHIYKNLFGMDTLIFEDKADALLMTRYTGNEVHHRHAILSMNLAGGGGIEIWQFISRTPLAKACIQPGDPGIFAARVKTKNVTVAHRWFIKQSELQVSKLLEGPGGQLHFWVCDQYDNHFNIVQNKEWFNKKQTVCGGIVGAAIGVSDMEKALHFYQTIMDAAEIVYDKSEPSFDMPNGVGNEKKFRRVLLRKPISQQGAFSKLLGGIEIELVQAIGETTIHIYKDRYWGDCGFIHLCFDVINMDNLKTKMEKAGYIFTVDSASSFSMGTSAGRFCYTEDPDGTLIELVETHRVPIFKKLGWYLDLQKRKDNKRLPGWMISLLALNKIR